MDNDTAKDSDTNINVLELLQDDYKLITLANQYRTNLACSPYQSNFRVLALFMVEIESLAKGNGNSYRDSNSNSNNNSYSYSYSGNGSCASTRISEDKELLLIKGANVEQGYIGGSICAERAAICSLRFLTTTNYNIVKVGVVTDNSKPISPGSLCREFMMSVARPDTPVVIGNHNSQEISNCNLVEIWPMPYVYRYQRRDNLLQFAENCAQFINLSNSVDTVRNSVENSESDGNLTHNLTDRVVEILRDFARRHNQRDRLSTMHPISLSAALLYDDNTVSVSWMLKGLEYGCTLDPVTQLIRDMQKSSADLCVDCSSISSISASKNLSNSSNCTCYSVDDRNNETNLTYQIDEVKEKGTRKPVLLLMVDQFGVCHAPFAQARALLNEHGYGNISVAVHNFSGIVSDSILSSRGDYNTYYELKSDICSSTADIYAPLQLHKMKDLLPPPPGQAKFLTHDDFL